MRLDRWDILIACGLVLALFLISPLAAQSPAPGPQGGGPVCPLSEERTNKATRAFDQLTEVFTKEPRCVNCHGAVNPFAPAGGDHLGGMLTVIRAGGQIDLNATNAQCQLCHGGLPGWKLAPANDVFMGRTAVQICKNQKFVFGKLLTSGPDGFANHIRDDVGGVDFIGNAFFGDRGLNLTGIGNYDAATGPGSFKLEPVTTVTHAQLNALARQWADALGSKFQGDDECGCVPRQYALKIEEDFRLNAAALGLRVTLVMNNEFQVPLTFKDDGAFEGTGTYTRIVKLIANDPESGCTGQVTPQTVTWKVNGSLVGSALDRPGVMQFKLQVSNSAETLTITGCRDTPRNPPPFTIPGHSDTLALPDMAAVVGESQSKDLSFPEVGLSSKMTVTIVQTK